MNGKNIRTTTLEDLFGPLSEQFFKKKGFPIKPNPKLFLYHILPKFRSDVFAYVGDQTTDLQFCLKIAYLLENLSDSDTVREITGVPKAGVNAKEDETFVSLYNVLKHSVGRLQSSKFFRGVIIPRNPECITSLEESLKEQINTDYFDYPNHEYVIIEKEPSNYGAVLEAVKKLYRDSGRKRRVCVGFDLDDTLFEKFSQAQYLAARELLRNLQHQFNIKLSQNKGNTDPEYKKANKVKGRYIQGAGFIEGYATNIFYRRKDGRRHSTKQLIGGSDVKLWVAMRYVAEGNRLNFFDGKFIPLDYERINELLDQAAYDPAVFVAEARDSCLPLLSKTADNWLRIGEEQSECDDSGDGKQINIYSPLFRQNEAKISRKLVEKEEVPLWREAYNLITELKKLGYVDVCIITNKPYLALKDIYNVPFVISKKN